jgi:Domain of unknown function (DUF397)
MRDSASSADNVDNYNPYNGWRKSSHSMSNGACLETALLPGGWVGVRDSAASATDAVLRFRPGSWASFLAVARNSSAIKDYSNQ